MLQENRNYLFNAAYALDNRKRIKGRGDQLFVIFTHEELEKHASDLRQLAEDDGARVAALDDKTKKR